MNRSEIAKAAGITRQHIDYIFAGKRRPSAELATELERITGIDRRAWLWPEEFQNPLLKQEAIPTAIGDEQHS
jgi:transcriptional regulator with XRE-family HTH domain